MAKEQQREPDLREAVSRARTARGAGLENLLYHRSQDVLEALLENPQLREQHLMILLARRDLPREIVSRVAQRNDWMKSYSVKLAVVKHPRTPRYLALPLMNFLYLFDLLAVATAPGVPADLKRVVEDAILSQLEGIALGQRLSLARRGSHRGAAGLLADGDPQVIAAALSNPSLTEPAVAAALLLEKSTRHLTESVLGHPRWSAQYNVKLALLRNKHLSLARCMRLLPDLARTDLVDLVSDPRVAGNVRIYVSHLMKTKGARQKSKQAIIGAPES